MGTLSDDNFGNDGARQYLGMLAAKLLATVTEVFRDKERLSLDEDGESMFMPSVELLALLCERYGVTPPKAATVQQWHDCYLQVYNAQIGRYNPDPTFHTERRRTIEKTFRWLHSLSESYWES